MPRFNARDPFPNVRPWPVATSLVDGVEDVGRAVERLHVALAKLPIGYRWLPLCAVAPELADTLVMIHEAELHFRAHGLDG
jgi:hypothetical protein